MASFKRPAAQKRRRQRAEVEEEPKERAEAEEESEKRGEAEEEPKERAPQAEEELEKRGEAEEEPKERAEAEKRAEVKTTRTGKVGQWIEQMLKVAEELEDSPTKERLMSMLAEGPHRKTAVYKQQRYKHRPKGAGNPNPVHKFQKGQAQQKDVQIVASEEVPPKRRKTPYKPPVQPIKVEVKEEHVEPLQDLPKSPGF